MVSVFLLQGFLLFGAEPKFPFSAIPRDLSAGADVVVRISEMTYEVKSLTQSSLKVHLALTVLKGSALRSAELVLFYDRDSKVNTLEMNLYDQWGNEIKKKNKDEIIDRSAIPEGTFFSDDRCKLIRPVVDRFPFTVEYFYEITYKRILFYPRWMPQDEYHMAVERSTLTLIAPEKLFPRYSALNMHDSGVVIKKGGDQSVIWTVENLKPILRLPYSPPADEIFPTVYVAPNTFSIQGYDADFTSWKTIGDWNLFLNQGRDDISATEKEKIRNMTKQYSTKRDQVKAIYRYMQSKTRYVGVQLGIGGWQPAKASLVEEKGYGDCKALVNYTKALLAATNISSYYTCINAGKNEMFLKTDFPSLQFNHIILCVPMDNDTLWLECTSQTAPFGYLGSFTDNRPALVITDQGGKLVHTPAYSTAENARTRAAWITVYATGDALANSTTTYRGLQFESVATMTELSPEDQKKWVGEMLDLPHCEISACRYAASGDEIPLMRENLELKIPSYASVSGGRLFVPLVFLDKQNDLPERDDNRTTDFIIFHGKEVRDSICFKLPDGYVVEHLPKGKDISAPYGNYRTTCRQVENQLIFSRSYLLNPGRYPGSQYNQFVEFLKQVSRADREKAILMKQ